MARHPRPPGSVGEIGLAQLNNERWIGNARARARDGRVVRVRAVGRTRAEAHDRTAARAAAVAGSVAGVPARAAAVTARSTVPDLCAAWVDEQEADAELSPRSIATYRSNIANHLRPTLGELSVGEATTPALAAFLRTRSPGVWRTSRAILRGAWTWAVQAGVVDADPTRSLPTAPRTRAEPDALTPAQLRDWLAAIAAYQWDPDLPGATPPRAEPLARLVQAAAGTGLRVSELLAMQWGDVDLSATPPTLSYAPAKQRAAAARAGRPRRRLSVALPAFAVEALREQHRGARPLETPWVWATASGRPVGASNLRRWLRAVSAHAQARGVALPPLHPHLIRHSVATWVAGTDLRLAQQQLGHTSMHTTEDYYVARLEAADAAAELDAAWASGRRD